MSATEAIAGGQALLADATSDTFTPALAVRRGHRGATLRSICGRVICLHVDRWMTTPALEEGPILDRVSGPVLDVGCGPARHTLELQRRGISVLGIDSSSEAVRIASRRGARVLRASVFDRLPDEGLWGSVLLLDGNLGIGGDPERLLARARGLVRDDGGALVEVESPGAGSHRLDVVLEVDGARRTDPFPWALVEADDLASVAQTAGFVVAEVWDGAGRWFARLEAAR
ncbi:MAG: class I SAM-dependent methyltransferase [Actinomycetota bacterium]